MSNVLKSSQNTRCILQLLFTLLLPDNLVTHIYICCENVVEKDILLLLYENQINMEKKRLIVKVNIWNSTQGTTANTSLCWFVI